MTSNRDLRLEEMADWIRYLPGYEWRQEATNGIAWWVTQAARKSALLMGSDPVVFATGAPYKLRRFEDTPEGEWLPSEPGRFVAFSKHLVVDSRITEGATTNVVHTQTRIVSRTALREIIPSDNAITSWPSGSFWPRGFDLQLRYDGLDEPIEVLAPGTEDTNRVLGVIEEVVHSLVRDLCRESAVSWEGE